jgi:peroxiredoxin/tetratricopeptide (TPR) repeat protein
MHGEAFNEGPRQYAQWMPGMGKVDFPISTSHAEAQKFFNQGVGQLHGFWYYEAERSFRQTAFLDPECAMAHWGLAMANIKNSKRAAEFIKQAIKLKNKASPREQRYIDAWAAYYDSGKRDEKARRTSLVRALEDLVIEFPDDVEARAFLVFQLWDNKQNDIPLPSRLAVDALAQQVLERESMHPGIHHYLIHLWNYQKGDKQALASAARCGQSAPGIAHMWHMSGHTFSELKRYPEAAWQQEASARVDHAYTLRARVLPEQIHNYAHNNDWLVKNLASIGRIDDAIDLAKNLIELPRLSKGRQRAWQMGRERILEFAPAYERWKEIITLGSSIYLGPDEDPSRETSRLRALGSAAFAEKQFDFGESQLAALEALLVKTRDERSAAVEKAEAAAIKEKKPEADIAAATGKAYRTFSKRFTDLQRAMAEVRLHRAAALGNVPEARKHLSEATDIPSIRKARIHTTLGDFEEAEKLARDAVNADPALVLPHAILVDALWQVGKFEAAKKAFADLRKRSAWLDLDAAPFARLAPVAAALDLPIDWRLPASTPADAGDRPELTSLGPFRWRPFDAPAFSLPDKEHKPVALSDYAGRPVLVVFYLGAGCAHCIEQLNALAPLVGDYAAAGIDVLAISTDIPDGLQQTFQKATAAGGFSFPILSDHEFDIFRAYQAFDDFEQTPLHGTFLIDAAGFIRWQNISHEPFNDLKWLLTEATRLLSIPVSPEPRTAASLGIAPD